MGHDLHNLGDFGDGARVSRSAGGVAAGTLGDGWLEGRLVALSAETIDADLFSQDVESVAADFSMLLDEGLNWDDDAAEEVKKAALAYMIAVCRLVRNATGG